MKASGLDNAKNLGVYDKETLIFHIRDLMEKAYKAGYVEGAGDGYTTIGDDWDFDNDLLFLAKRNDHLKDIINAQRNGVQQAQSEAATGVGREQS